MKSNIRKIIMIVGISQTVIGILAGAIFALIYINSGPKYDISKFESSVYDAKVYIPVVKDGKYGFINEDGEEKIPCQYDNVSWFSKVTYKGDTYQIALACKDGLYGFITKDNQTMFFDKEASEVFNNTFTSMMTKSGNVNDTNILTQMAMVSFETLKAKYDPEWRASARENETEIKLKENTTGNYIYNGSEFNIEIEKKEKSLTTNDIKKYLPTNVTITNKGGTTTNREYIPYDEEKLTIKLYDDGYIPFYNKESTIQGWYDKSGNKITIAGKFEVLNVRNGVITIKNYDTSNGLKPIIFMNMNGNVYLQASEVEILDTGYIIAKDDGKQIIINDELQTISNEYDRIVYSLLNEVYRIEEKSGLTSYGVYHLEVYEEN